MTNKQIRLNESEFKKLLKETVMNAVKATLNEGFADREMWEKWIDAEQQLGSENMLIEVYEYFSGDQLRDFLQSIDGDYDLGLFDDEYDEEEDDEIRENKNVHEGLFKTYNQRHTYKYGEHPEYQSKEWRKMYGVNKNNVKKFGASKDSDGYVIGVIQRDIQNLGDIVSGKINPFEPSANVNDGDTVGNVALMLSDHGLEMAKEYNLPKYYEYLQQLRKQVADIMKNGEQAQNA